MTTPYGLNTGNATVRTALGDAIARLRKAHIPLNTTLGAVQYVTYSARRRWLPIRI